MMRKRDEAVQALNLASAETHKCRDALSAAKVCSKSLRDDSADVAARARESDERNQVVGEQGT